MQNIYFFLICWQTWHDFNKVWVSWQQDKVGYKGSVGLDQTKVGENEFAKNGRKIWRRNIGGENENVKVEDRSLISPPPTQTPVPWHAGPLSAPRSASCSKPSEQIDQDFDKRANSTSILISVSFTFFLSVSLSVSTPLRSKAITTGDSPARLLSPCTSRPTARICRWLGPSPSGGEPAQWVSLL